MTLQFFSSSSRLARLALTGLIASQVAIVTTVIHELVATTPGVNRTQQANAQGMDEDLSQIYEKVSQAVVLIQTPNSSGSGAIIAANGLIVTNAHVVEGFNRVQVTLRDGRRLMGEVVASGSSGCVDLAMVRLLNQTKLPTIELAPSNSAKIGANVFAIGNALNTRDTLTAGRISNLIPQWKVYTDARLNPGNSGGPLLNYRGQLVGVIKGGYGKDAGGDGLNYAVAAEQVRAFMQAPKQGLSPVLGRYMLAATPESTGTVSKLALTGAKSNGVIQRNDNLVCDGSRADLYTFKGEADQPIMIRMTSSQIGSSLVLLGPNGESIASPKANQSGTAMVLTKLPKAGTYTVVAKALRPKQLGAYQLQATVPLLAEQGRLTSNSPQLRNGSPYSSYRFVGQSNQTINIFLHQFAFDPYLILQDAEGRVVAKGKASQAMIRVKLPRDGSYTLIVSTVKPSDRGQFFLSVHSSQETQTSPASQNR
ncbi:MAG: trypsin-like peptidase domain-containing protein [Lyngbya sp. HA4199-MV5]|jgi:serine protease Do|nr:trypsin-like peptidase domain-containing protein [Lyngbya sp. HA4199-MV5]